MKKKTGSLGTRLLVHLAEPEKCSAAIMIRDFKSFSGVLF